MKSSLHSWMVRGWNLWGFSVQNAGNSQCPSPSASVCMEAGAGDLIWNPHQLYLKLQHKSPDLNHWVQLLKQSLDNIFCTEHSRNCLTKERNGSLWYKKLPPFSVFLEVVLLRMVCTWLLGLQDLSAEHHHFMHVFPEDSEQKGLFFLNLCSWCWCYFVLIVW